ncbi:uncharacterized protein BX664DRAFT_289128 [Halteromyces radiatus]|uniref:uncharacterized protein n=1 Tax=Halteromyces radiatus TaxID=101107 RepID=UPI00221F3B9A|nr:uncharacterized protein BX664DRAFT_289128 [Halteromyces radiatus]KAI8099167.1 hypothetical protein BX664DRAFT_289128 [Halteromyces radiatus]
MNYLTILLVLVGLAVNSIIGQLPIQQQDDTPSICLSLRDSKACPAFHQFYVSTGVVDRYPFLPNNISTIQELDNGLFSYVNSTSDYLLPLGCLSTNYSPNVPYARYAITKMCARLIQDEEDSLPCNTEHHVIPPPLCRSTCLDWVNSITAITSQPSVCSDSIQRTDALANYTNHCLSWQGYNATTDDNCIAGFANEPENCGFRDDIKQACQFCQNTTNAASSNCCQMVNCATGLNLASIIGITVGTLMGASLLLLACYCLCSRHWSRHRYFNKNDKKTNNKFSSSTSFSYFSDSKTAIHDDHHLKHWPEDTTTTTTTMTSTNNTSTTSFPPTIRHDHHLQPYQLKQEDLYTVIHAYPPQMDDELALNIGDIIMLALPFDDGWALGINMSTGLKGAFPLVCVSPASTFVMEQWRSSRISIPPPSFITNTTSSIPKRMTSKSSNSTSHSDTISPFLDSHPIG